MNAVRALLAAGLLVLVACGGGAGPSEPVDAAGTLDRPILSLSMAAVIHDDGSVEPSARFGPDQGRVSAMVGVGDVEGVLVVTWYRVGAEGDEQLFAHSVPVAAFDRAFSTAESPGRLAAGEYRVVAEVSGDSRGLSWRVHTGDAAVTQDAGEAEALLAAAAADADAPAGDPPVAGDSGTLPQAEPVSATDLGCLFALMDSAWNAADDGTATDTTADIVEFNLFAPFCDEGELVVSASAGGAAREIADARLPLAAEAAELWFWLDPCGLDAGSDLPGTAVELTVEMHEGPGAAAWNPTVITLGPDQTPPELAITTDPPAGTKVDPGDVITIEVTASERREPGTTWQTGVFWVAVGGAVQPIVVERFGDAPLPCDDKSWTQTLTTTYTVPPDPPPVINIVAIAHDYARGNYTIDRAQFPTSDIEHWSGTFSSVNTGSSCSGSAEGEVRITVEGGQVTGSIDGTEAGSCGGNAYAHAGIFGLRGTFDGVAFQVSGNPTSDMAIASWVCFWTDPAPAITVGPPGTASAEWTFSGEHDTYSCSMRLQREDGAG